MFVLVIHTGTTTRTESRNSGAAHISAWKTLKSLGYNVVVHNAFDATATMA